MVLSPFLLFQLTRVSLLLASIANNDHRWVLGLVWALSEHFFDSPDYLLPLLKEQEKTGEC